MKLTLTPRQVDLLRGAIMLRIETSAEQLVEPPDDDDGRVGTLPDWVREQNAELRREIAALERIVARLNT